MSPSEMKRAAHQRAVDSQRVMFAGGATFGAVADAYPALIAAAYRELDAKGARK